MSWPPGWYEDPWRPGSSRWWDGGRWTELTAAAATGGSAAGKRRLWPWLLGAALVILLFAGGAALVAIVVSSDDEIARRPSQARRAPATPKYEEPASNRLPPVGLGETVTLRNQDGQRVRVTVLGVEDPVPRGDYFRGPKRGTRWVGVRARFQGEGPGTYNDSAANGLRVLTGEGRYEADFSELDACPPLRSGDLTLSPGESVQGCTVIPVPRGEKPERVRFTPSSGYAPDVGTWRVGR